MPPGSPTIEPVSHRTPARESGPAREASTAYGARRRAVNAAAAAVLLLILAALTPAAAPRAGEALRILALGDSLTAGHGLAEADGFTAQLGAALAEAGVSAEVINAGIAGDTTAGGRARLDWALADEPDLVILELGANDGLRGIDPAETEANLDAILARLAEAGIPVLFAGMLAPPNLGPEYGAAFNGLFPALAEKHGVAAFYPFFLAGVAAEPSLNQPDGLHPNRAGVAVIVQRILPPLLQVIGGLDRRPAEQG